MYVRLGMPKQMFRNIIFSTFLFTCIAYINSNILALLDFAITIIINVLERTDFPCLTLHK